MRGGSSRNRSCSPSIVLIQVGGCVRLLRHVISTDVCEATPRSFFRPYGAALRRMSGRRDAHTVADEDFIGAQWLTTPTSIPCHGRRWRF